ncbi:hypothetical protein BJV78DRAFT_1240485 [Lactifluus subvellereus]|nr:hypothetical protein BJV78DRAFT_1240485 [Lactifluus subvellereus]
MELPPPPSDDAQCMSKNYVMSRYELQEDKAQLNQSCSTHPHPCPESRVPHTLDLRGPTTSSLSAYGSCSIPSFLACVGHHNDDHMHQHTLRPSAHPCYLRCDRTVAS